jgi:hypothetical protein
VASSLATGSSDLVTSLVPGIAALARGLIDLVDDVGELLLFVLWGAVSAMIFGCAWIMDRIFTPATQRLFTSPPPPYAPTNTEFDPALHPENAQQTAARVFDRLRQRGIGNLKRDPGKDHWRAS